MNDVGQFTGARIKSLLEFDDFLRAEKGKWSLESFGAFDRHVKGIEAKLGPNLVNSPFWKKFLCGIGSQYRGTIITGAREYGKYFVRRVRSETSFSDEEVGKCFDSYLAFYFGIYGRAETLLGYRGEETYSHTIGEIFQDVLLQRRQALPWNILRLSISAVRQGEFEYRYRKMAANGIICGIHELTVDGSYLDGTIDRGLKTSIDSILKDLRRTDDSASDMIDRMADIRARISYAAYLGARMLLPAKSGAPPTKGLFHAVQFLRHPGSNRFAECVAWLRNNIYSKSERDTLTTDLEGLLRAVLLWHVYSFTSNEDTESRDVAVIAPGEIALRSGAEHGANEVQQAVEEERSNHLPFMAPKLGFALWLHTDVGPNRWNRVYKNITKDILVPLDTGLRNVASAFGDAIEASPSPERREETLAAWGGSQRAQNEITTRVKSTITNEGKAAQLLTSRVGSIASMFASLAPHFRHEGFPFPLAVVVGREYHSQVVGRELESLKEYVRDVSREVSRSFKPVSQGDDFRYSRELVLALIRSRVSLLEWPGSLLFVPLEANASGAGLESLRRLDDVNRHEEMPRLLQQLTERRVGLFALWFDWQGATVFGGGHTLALQRHGRWHAAKSDYGTLSKEVTDVIRRISGLSHLHDITDGLEQVIRPFVRVLRRISEAPRFGAMFVLRSKAANATYGDSPDPIGGLGLPSAVLPLETAPRMPHGASVEWDEELLFRLAILDGSTLIELDPEEASLAESWKNATIKFRRQVGCRLDLSKLGEVWTPNAANDIPEIFNYGVRRASALALAATQPGVAVISVSADGGIRFSVRAESGLEGSLKTSTLA